MSNGAVDSAAVPPAVGIAAGADAGADHSGRVGQRGGRVVEMGDRRDESEAAGHQQEGHADHQRRRE